MPRNGSRQVNQTDLIIEDIMTRIEAGRLAPGDVLVLCGVGGEFDVSRTPVREAILQMEAIGIVKRKPRGGAVIFQPTIEEFLAILEVHAKLEGHAAGLAARRIGPDDAGRIEAALKKCEDHAARFGDSEPDLYYLCNLEFHKAVAEAAHNGVLLDLIKTNARKLLAYYRARYRYKGSIGLSAKEHKVIVDAILDRDSDRAEALMAEHVQFDSVTAMDLIAALKKPEAEGSEPAK